MRPKAFNSFQNAFALTLKCGWGTGACIGGVDQAVTGEGRLEG